MNPKHPISRRQFIRTSATAAAAVATPMFLPSCATPVRASSRRIRVGHIGCGRIAKSHDMPGVIRSGLADIVAVCDVDSRRAAEAPSWLRALYSDAGAEAPAIGVYTDCRELLARSDINAVVLSLPDHQHAEVALRAIMAGKDIYLQKPFTMTHAEGVILRDAAVKAGTVLQIGSQQRSWGNTQQFRKACEFVRSGRVGRLQRVEIGLPVDPTKPDDPEQPVPANLDYDAWLGPTPLAYYTEQRVHSQQVREDGRLDVESRPGWLRNENYCLGMITGWGSHHFDTAHWGMDMELSGPLRIEGRGEFPENKIWNVHGAYDVELTYPGGIIMRVTDKQPNGIKFIGDEGWIFVSRNTQTLPDGSGELKALDASDARLLDPEGVTVKFLESDSHHRNWLDCVRSRAKPLAPAEVAHRSNTACILSWIAMKLQRPLEWDAAAERFVNDAEANAMLTRPERPGHGAIHLAASV